MNNQECSQCQLRRKCPIRPLFYIDDYEFEVGLQFIETQIKKQGTQIYPISDEMADQKAFTSIEKVRIKRIKELNEHKNYSVE